MNVDLSQFDNISDRVARAKAKAEAVRNAKKSDGAGDSGGSEAAAANTDGAVAAVAEAEAEAKSGLPILEFQSGLHFKWRNRAARTIGIRYDLVSFVYDDEPDQVITA
ncbi:hypothetical protein MK139_01895, partial [bacterium]|nr:hypothetical protein [bacterium]